ncbi:MAG: aminotransferase class V-fold PLP-dependent enzyme, partial [Candidatus Nanohaloarchaea archaeon]
MNMSLDAARLKKDFPVLEQQVNDEQLVYLDNAATTHKPGKVIEAVNQYWRTSNSNPGRSLHELANRSREAYSSAREKTAEFIAASSREV